MRRRYQTNPVAAEKARQWALRYRNANIDKVRENDRNRGYRGTRVKVYNDSRGIPKQPCEVCGTANAEKHHDDYDKPREVRWLCKKHHMELHRRF